MWGMGRRIWQMDALRGVAMALMAVYHLLVDLRDFYGVAGIDYARPPLLLIGRASAVLFILVAGASCALSKNNLRRGARVFAGGMAITAATWLYVPTRALYIRFGILHFLGSAMAIAWAARLLPAFAGGKAAAAKPAAGGETAEGKPAAGGKALRSRMAAAAPWLAAAVACAAAGAALSGRTAGVPFLFPIGLPTEGFATYDYYPLFPWLAVFFAGVAAGAALFQGRVPAAPAGASPSALPSEAGPPAAPEGNRPPAALRALSAFGRKSFIFYFAHQPALIAVLELWFRLSR